MYAGWRRRQMDSTMMQSPLTLTPILERAGKLFGEVELVSRLPNQSLHRSNYASLWRRSRALAAALTASGLGRGECVASLMWNHSWHLEAYFGVPASGNVLHTLNLRLHPDELAYIMNHAGDRVLIVDDVLLPLYEKLRAKVKVDRVIVVPATGRQVPAPYENYEQFLTQGAEDYVFPQLDENQAAVMCYTSGTTGVPKGVVYSHRALILHSLCIALPDCFDLSQCGCILPVVPMFHANAWGCPYAATITGMKQVLPGPHLDAASLLDLMEREKVTRSGGVPTVWLGILELLERQPGRWKLEPGLRVAVGGAALPEAMIRAFDREGIDVRQAWGMTEITPVGTFSRLKSHMSNWPERERLAMRAKQGIQLPFIEVRAVAGEQEVLWTARAWASCRYAAPGWRRVTTICPRFKVGQATGGSVRGMW